MHIQCDLLLENDLEGFEGSLSLQGRSNRAQLVCIVFMVWSCSRVKRSLSARIRWRARWALCGLVEVFLLLKKGSQLFLKRFIRLQERRSDRCLLDAREVSDGSEMWQEKSDDKGLGFHGLDLSRGVERALEIGGTSKPKASRSWFFR